MALPHGMEHGKGALASLVVKKALENGRLEHLVRRIAGFANHYPPSPVVLDRFIASDIELRDNILEAVRSFYPPTKEQPLRTISDCVNVMPLRDLSEIAVTFILKSIFEEVFQGGFLSHEMMKNSIAIAAGTQWFAPNINVDPERAYIFGLLYRIGIPILASYSSTDYASCIAHLPGSMLQLEDIERGGFDGINQFDVAAAVGFTYEMPDWFTQVISGSSIPTQLRKAAALAAHIAHKAGYDMGVANVASELLPREFSALKADIADTDDIKLAMRRAVDYFQAFTTES